MRRLIRFVSRPQTDPSGAAVTGTVRGRVQGVSFRYAMRREAVALGVAGWVKNLPDGRVAFHAEGPQRAVDALLRWARRGPPLARVDGLDCDRASIVGAADFDIVR